jgi:hypothetical protein
MDRGLQLPPRPGCAGLAGSALLFLRTFALVSRDTTQRSGRLLGPGFPSAAHAARCACLGVGLLLTLAGCHGGAQTDIVERELRWQEDQIYAMEDYLEQYQQLLCEYRAENAALKRQMARRQLALRRSDSTRDRNESAPRRTRQRTHGDSIPLPNVPSLDQTMPELKTPPRNSGANQPVENGPNLEFRSVKRQPKAAVRRTNLEEPDESSESITPLAEPTETAALEPPGSIRHVALQGDVLPDDGQSGPRLLVDVAPLSASGRQAAFEGELSLMVLDAAGKKQRGIARWDFSPDDLAQLIDQEASEPMQFPLQLPADTPTDRPIQLWVRLVPEGGEKVLTHVELDLRQAGRFASDRPRLMVAEQTGAVTDGPDLGQRIAASDDTNMSLGEWDGWHVARPGQPVKIDARDGRPDTRWRKATQPIPQVENHSRPVRPRSREDNKKQTEPIPTEPPAPERLAEAIEPPAWSPERDTDAEPASADVSAPVWSPER